jgi:hypothetical protein
VPRSRGHSNATISLSAVGARPDHHGTEGDCHPTQVFCSRSDLDKSGRVEVAVECECFADAPAAHNSEARCVHKRILTLWATTEPPPSICLDWSVDVNDLDIGQQGQSVQESDCSSVSRAPANQGPGFPDHMIGSQNPAYAASYESTSILMATVTTFLKAEPEAGVSEPQRLCS